MSHHLEPGAILALSSQELTSSDIALVLPLNNAHALETSLLSDDSLSRLLQMAFFACGIGHGALAFLIALDQDAPYDNANHVWFKSRFQSFVYIDRVIVSTEARGCGFATQLYEELFAAAEQAGHRRVVCEVNIDPPNPASLAFHARLGFAALGEGKTADGKKSVRYLERLL